MGGKPSKELIYSLPLQGTETENSTCICRSSFSPNELISNFKTNPIRNAWDIFKIGASKCSKEFCLGSRKKLENGQLGSYEWKTYEEVEELALSVAISLLNIDAVPEVTFDESDDDEENDKLKQKTSTKKENEILIEEEKIEEKKCSIGNKKYRFIGIYSKNREEWTICEQACNVSGVAIVPLYDILGSDATSFIISETCMKTIVASDECAVKILSLNKFPPSLKNIILLDPIIGSMVKKAEKNGISLIPFQKLVEDGKKINNKEDVLLRYMPNGETVNTICYTSGTTGKPKGVIMTHANFVATVCAAILGPLATDDIVLGSSDIHISYLPMAHVFERVIANLIFTAGARIGFYGGDTQKLLDDIQVLKPTVFCSVPRLFNKINEKVINSLKDKSPVAKFIFEKGMNAKLGRIRESGIPQYKFWDTLVFNKTRKLMGGQIRYMLTGSAPLDSNVQDKMKALFCAPLLEGYGMTESIGATFLTNSYDCKSGHIGGPLPSVEFKIVSIPEMNYFVNDKDVPKGELVLRGASISPGYFRNKKETRETFKDGWLHTGDAASLLPNGSVKIFDRIKNIFKLAHGEYVIPEKIENIYSQALLVSQIFVFGYSTKAVLVGIVVPDVENSMKWAKSNNRSAKDYKQLCLEPALKNVIFEEMKIFGKEAELKGFEFVKDIRIIDEPFTIENDLLTPTFKLKRHHALQKYKHLIDEMYEKLEV